MMLYLNIQTWNNAHQYVLQRLGKTANIFKSKPQAQAVAMNLTAFEKYSMVPARMAMALRKYQKSKPRLFTAFDQPWLHKGSR